MASFVRMRDRLPSLYRPELNDASLLTLFLRATAQRLDEVAAESSNVMQAHWFAYADRALYDPFFLRSRTLLHQPLPKLSDKVDRAAIDEFPYIHDLARLAALLALPPWREPPHLRESVEEYRLRIARTVALYRNGLGTLDALRGMVEAQLPVNLSAIPGQADRPFWLEEFAPLVRRIFAVSQPGEPVDMVGPLMRWTLQNDGIEAAPATLYIQGVTPQAQLIDATENPLIELYQHGSQSPRVGIAFRGTLTPDQTLRLRPTFTSWLGMSSGVLLAETSATENNPADPTAPGGWQAAEDMPEAFATATVVAMLQTEEQTLWFAVNGTDTLGALWRYNGRAWEQVLRGLSPLHCLAEDRQTLLIGTATGLLQMSLYGEADVRFVANPVAALGEQPVYTILAAAAGQWWFGTEQGLIQRVDQVDATQVYQPFVLHADAAVTLAIYAIYQDQEPSKRGTFYFGTNLGLFQFQPGSNQWYWYAGEEHTEQKPDWQLFKPEEAEDQRNFPTENRVFLPAVHRVYRGPDVSLWLGTEQGIARYIAHAVNGFTYETVVEAFPELVTGRVFAIQEDQRGLIWFGTERGLFRYDGRDWWQFQAAGGWVQLGRADTLYTESIRPEPAQRFPRRGVWRFHRGQSLWQRFDANAAIWNNFSGELRSTAESAVHSLLWADHVMGDVGTWDGAQFSVTGTVKGTDLVMRYKIDETQMVDGGFPAVPRLPVGDSVWRYLALEPAGFVEPEPRPAWTIEGRLLIPPSEHAAPPPGRYNLALPPPSTFDQAIFAFHPAARVWFEWEAKRGLAVLVRLKKQTADEQIDPAILDRVWQGVQQVRPAGVRTVLAVEEDVLRK